jgi:preprotein translocase SecE subunit
MAKTPRRRASNQRPTTNGAAAAPPAARSPEERRGSSAPALPSAPPRTQQRRRNPFGFLSKLQPRGVGDVIAELRKVTWPTAGETRYLTFVVAVVAIVMGIILGSFDLAFGWLIERFFFE